MGPGTGPAGHAGTHEIADWEAGARSLGLDKALTGFPRDVEAGFRRAERLRNQLPLHPLITQDEAKG